MTKSRAEFEHWKAGLTSPYFWDPDFPDESNPPICNSVNGRAIPIAKRCPRCAVLVGPRDGEKYQCTAWKPTEQLKLF